MSSAPTQLTQKRPSPRAKRARRTSTVQEYRSQTSRDLILDATVECLARFGHAETSTLKVQQMAGVSRGRLLYHFATRDQLLIAAAQHLLDYAHPDDRPGAGPHTAQGARRIELAVRQLWHNMQQPTFVAQLELCIAARHHEPLRDALHQSRRALDRTFDDHFGATLVARPNYQLLRNLLIEAMTGASVIATAQARPAPAAIRGWVRLASMMLTGDAPLT